jgi:hypothetical protein
MKRVPGPWHVGGNFVRVKRLFEKPIVIPFATLFFLGIAFLLFALSVLLLRGDI